MLEVSKSITIPPIISYSSDESISYDLPLPLSANISPEILKEITEGNTLIKSINLKTGDIIRVNLSIKNENSLPLSPLKLKIFNDNNFSYINGSIINILTKEAYYSTSLNDNTILLKQLESGEKLSLTFYIKAVFDDLYASFNSVPLVLFPFDSNEHNFIVDDVTPIIVTISQGVLSIKTDSLKGEIEVENSGYGAVNNVFIKYTTPKSYYSDISSIKTTLNNSPYTIDTKQIEGDIIFSISNIPPSSFDSPSKLTISFNSYDTNTIHAQSITIS